MNRRRRSLDHGVGALDAGHFDAIGQPSQPRGMQSEKFADLRPLRIVAFAQGKPLEFRCLRDLLLRDFARLPTSCFRTELVEELEKGINVSIHSIELDAGQVGCLQKICGEVGIDGRGG